MFLRDLVYQYPQLTEHIFVVLFQMRDLAWGAVLNAFAGKSEVSSAFVPQSVKGAVAE